MPERLSPPPQPSISTWRQTLRFMRDPFSLMAEARAECGDVFTLRLLGLGSWVFVCSPELASEMFRIPEAQLSASDAGYRFIGFLVGKKSIVSQEGKTHRRRRRLSSNHLNGFGAVIHTEAIRQVVAREIEDWPREKPFSLLPRAKTMFIECFFRALTGAQDSDRLDRLVRGTRQFTSCLRSPLMQMKPLQVDLGRFSPWGRILFCRRDLAREISLLAESTRQRGSSSPESLLRHLLEALDEEGQPLSLDIVTDEILTLVVAGEEATSRFLCWTIQGILSHPDVLRRLRAELDSVLQGQPIATRHLPKLEYLDAVVQEGLRYQPLAAFNTVRLVRQPCEFGGYGLSAGMVVTQGLAEIGKSPDLFDQPSGFHPENFMGHETRVDWHPFGGGPRVCLGRGFALLDLKVTVATIFQHLELTLAQTNVRSMPGGFMMEPENGLLLRASRRDDRRASRRDDRRANRRDD